MKPWYKSRTIWIAIIQGVSGLFLAAVAEYPELQTIGGLMMAKTGLDMILRFLTVEQIEN